MVFRWRRPLLLTYYDNYRYGTSLYSSTAEEVEKKYRDSLSRTYLRSDRGDLGLSTFSGSQLHGGMPASSGDSGTETERTKKKSGPDLYAPMSFGYGRSYYNNLRASSEPRTTKKSSSDAKKSSSYYKSTEEKSTTQDINKSSSSTTLNKIIKTSTDYDTTVNKTVTTTDRWVPLSHYLYPSTTSYYYYTEPVSQTTSDLYYLDDVKIKKTMTRDTKRDLLNALDLNVSSTYTSEKTTSSDSAKFDVGFWTDKCREIQSHLDHVNRWVADAETKIKTDLVGARNKMQTELSEVSTIVDDTTKYNDELQRVIRRQAKQIADLHSQHSEINRHLSDVNDNLEKSRARCQGLQAELANVQSTLEMASKRRQ